MDYIFGCTFAVISSIFFALYVVPKKLTKQNPVYYTFFMSIGYFASSTVAYLVNYLLTDKAEVFTEKIVIYSAVEGILWTVGVVMLLTSIDKIGLSRSNQWKNLQGPIGVVLSLVLLNEATHTNALFAILAGLAMFGSAIALNIKHTDGKKVEPIGIILALVSAVFFGIVTVINKFVVMEHGVYTQQVIWSLFVFITITVYLMIKYKFKPVFKGIGAKDIKLGLLGGVLYLGASMFMLQAYRYIPAAVGFTIIQLNALWVIGMGIWIFKEIEYSKNKARILGGLLFAVMGVVLLVFTR